MASINLLIVNGIITRGSTKLETQVECFRDDVMTLTTAIEEAIIKGQKSLGRPSGIPEWRAVLEEDFALTCADVGPGVVGWVDDF